ncbi:unnamed protein product, partial [Allacma fusca]
MPYMQLQMAVDIEEKTQYQINYSVFLPQLKAEFNTGTKILQEKNVECIKLDLQLELRNWALEENINLSSTSRLLKILQKCDINVKLPTDARTLLQTPRNVFSRPMGIGSSNSQLWPILGWVSNLPSSQPFVIGCYYGAAKPSDIYSYLADFVQE